MESGKTTDLKETQTDATGPQRGLLWPGRGSCTEHTTERDPGKCPKCLSVLFIGKWHKSSQTTAWKKALLGGRNGLVNTSFF